MGLTLTRAEECRAEGGRARWELEDEVLLVLLLVCFLLLAAPLKRVGPAFLELLPSSMAPAAMGARLRYSERGWARCPDARPTSFQCQGTRLCVGGMGGGRVCQ